MYKKGSKGWLKHFDFILLDMICLQIAFLLAYVIRHDSGSPYIVPLYRNMAIFMELLDIVVMFFYETLSNVLKRGYFREFAATVKHVLLVELFSVLYLFTMQEGQAYSRTALYLTGVIYAILTYIVRISWKKILRSRMSEENRSLLVVTTKDMAEQVVHNIRENNYERFALSGLVIIDDDLCGTKIAGVPVVANEENAAAYVCREWIDEVFVIPATDVPYPYALMEQFTEAGVTVHLNLAKVSEAMGGKKQLVEKVGPYTVLTTSINYASTKQLFMKRAIDIAGGLFGCLLTLLITLFVGPAIYLKSPGPIFFAQERVGKNGKKFKMYKFRSMYMDAEERKAELMKQNRVSDGMMFKLDFDPRVIGNEILPDGTKKTGIGNFIRVTSLDEFPQFFNVLKGDMSIVGTRPPTLDEWNKYELHHRARLAIKPGITGMWQVRECNKTSWQILSLMPLKVEKKPFKYEFCPVHLYLFENGQAVIKTSISIEDVDAKIFSTFPMPTWFGNIKAWEAAIQCGGRKEYKICEARDQKISIVTHILQKYVYRLFKAYKEYLRKKI